MSEPADPPAPTHGPTYHDWRADEQARRQQPGPILVTNATDTLATYDATWTAERALNALAEDCRQQVHQGRDLAVWRDGSLLAVVRQDPDRGPSVIPFLEAP